MNIEAIEAALRDLSVYAREALAKAESDRDSANARWDAATANLHMAGLAGLNEDEMDVFYDAQDVASDEHSVMEYRYERINRISEFLDSL